MSLSQKLHLKPVQLRYRFKSDWVPWETTRDVPACQDIIGQDRALRAIRLGLHLKSVGYNIFVTGLSGTGKTTTVKTLLEEIDDTRNVPDDLCYVNNFDNPDMPRILRLPAGKGRQFKKEMQTCLEQLKTGIPEILQSDTFKDQWEDMAEKARERERELVKGFEKKISNENFTLVQVQFGTVQRPQLMPVVGDEPVTMGDLEKRVDDKEFPSDRFQEIREKYKRLVSDFGEIQKQLKNLQKEIQEKQQELIRNVLRPRVEELINEIREHFPFDGVGDYLNDVTEAILNNLEMFQEKQEDNSNMFTAIMSGMQQSGDPFQPYTVNVIVDNSETEGAPIILEISPNYKNLFGTIEKTIGRNGVVQTDFSRIKAGSLLRANGGYLVINARDALIEPEVWKNLKRTLKYNEVSVQNWDPLSLYSSVFLKPEPIQVDVKVVMVGDKEIYQLLYFMDEDFKKIFKVLADFDSEMPNSKENVACFVALMSKICEEENLLHFDNSGIQTILEYAIRFAGRQKKLSTRFSDVADLMRESSFWATREQASLVKREYVERAIREKTFRSNLPEEKLQEYIEDDILLIDTEGQVTGQVNGLSVYMLGYYSFGKPTRITAEISLGRDGVVNVEREAKLSGKTHDKGVLILSNFIRSRYTRDKPLSMNASLCFEQSYGGVDGDSASSTEVYALLSELSGLPIRQDLAVTGSVNQKGRIQPIGGVNEKIEGFFDVCAARHLTGTQGVMIPVQNVDDLMLREEVVNAVKNGKFHIYAISTIDEGIEMLTGVPAGELQKDGSWTAGSVNDRVNRQLQELADTWRKFAGE